jgi:DNA-binding transcriptional MerR regulator
MKSSEGLWTLDDLTAEVVAALASGYEGAASGRVRDIPDRRTIRYYTTLGLIDRPATMRGRTALYGRRHALQIVAIKKLQAAGRSLAEIQTALAGQTTADLARLAGLGPPEESRAAAQTPTRNDRDFWRQEPAAHAPAEMRGDEDAAEAPPPVSGPDEESVLALCGIPLGHGITLLLAPSRPLCPEDLETIRSAAAPMVRTLIRSQLIHLGEGGETP